jgi:branched-chain amino acid aminotransferase
MRQVCDKCATTCVLFSEVRPYTAGTFAGLIPVTEVDGRTIGSGRRGAAVERLQGLYMELVREEAGRGRGVVVTSRCR